jgi:hypothetical protein
MNVHGTIRFMKLKAGSYKLRNAGGVSFTPTSACPAIAFSDGGSSPLNLLRIKLRRAKRGRKNKEEDHAVLAISGGVR